MKTYEEIFSEAWNAGLKAVEKAEKEFTIPWYPCGFAWVEFKVKGKLAKWLVQNNIAKKHVGQAGAYIWVFEHKQCMEKKYIHAVAMAEVLKAHGLDCHAMSRED